MLNICFYVFIGCHSLLRTVCSVCLPICWLDNLLLWLKLSHILDNEASVRCMACKVLLFCCCHFQCGCSLIWCSPICQLPRIKTESSSQWMQKMAFRKVSLSSRLKTRERGHRAIAAQSEKNRIGQTHNICQAEEQELAAVPQRTERMRVSVLMAHSILGILARTAVKRKKGV